MRLEGGKEERGKEARENKKGKYGEGKGKEREKGRWCIESRRGKREERVWTKK